MVTSQAQISDDDHIEDLLFLLVSFEKVGLKKVPERMKVLKEMKDRIDAGMGYRDLQ